ncbi:DNA helicase MCM8-like [Oppia nitens]|uniref:DNA helicase MCM8-like n=1 Tax=Oppia nitens TaxID=1686743 RepID=UPI0023DA8CD2|nr:DNA helicase MCM8-like [Oppia nitens]
MAHSWLQFDGQPDDMADTINYNMNAIQTIQNEPNLLRLLTASLCPQIYGHQLIKSGLLLALFGGAKKHDKQCPQIITRGTVHVLIFGDHGSHKDILLKSVHSCGPKSHYICGNTATMSALTTHYVKTNKDNQQFESGVLVSQQMAICCIDEFNAMNTVQQRAVQEVMDYQLVCFHRNEKYKQLAANTAIIAAVTPINGLFDNALNVWQNTKLSKSLLSKFDLIFNLIDFPDEELDTKFSNDLLVMHSNSAKRVKNNQKFCIQTDNNNNNRDDCPLKTKLTFGANDEEPDLIPHQLIRQYVDYAQQFIYPTICESAKNLLDEFSRNITESQISKSVTRNRETLYRLTEARARIELRGEATEEDARDVIDIVRHSIGKEYFVSNAIQSMKQLNQMSSFGKNKKLNPKNVLKSLQLFCQQNQQNVLSVDQIIDICSAFQFHSRDDVLRVIEKLNEESLLLKVGVEYKLL